MEFYIKLIAIIVGFFISDLTAQVPDVFIPYRIGDQWGICDTEKNIIVEPRFDEFKLFPKALFEKVTLFEEGFFKVKKDGFYGLVDTNDMVVLDCQYSTINIYENNIITYNSEGAQLLDEKGFNFLKKSFKRIIFPYKSSNLVLLVTQARKYGLITLNDSYDNVATILLDTIYDNINIHRDKKVFAYSNDKSTVAKYSYEDGKLNLIQEGNDVKEKMEFLDRAISDDNEFTNPRTFTSYILGKYYVDTMLYLVTVKNQCKDGRQISQTRDTLLEKPYKTIRGYYDQLSSKRLITRQDSILFKEISQNKFRRRDFFSAIVVDLNNKIGLLDGHGKLLISCQYDEMKRKFRLKKVPFFIVVKDGKHGVVDMLNNIIVPVNMDKMNHVHNSGERPDDKYGFQKDGLNGIRAFDRELRKIDYCPPIYSETIKKIKYINDYFLVELVDINGNFLGYANKEGLKYFEE